MKLGVTGTRDGLSPDQKFHAIRLVSELAPEVAEFHSGDCIGVDDQVLWMLLSQNVTPDIHLYPALVSERFRARAILRLESEGYEGVIIQYKPLGPKVRNGFIAENCDYLLAFPGSGGGTWDCVRKAQAVERQGVIVYPDGRVEPL